RPLLQVLLQLVDLRALAPDDDPRTRGADNDAQLIARSLDLNRAHARRLELFLQLVLQLHVLEQQLVVVPLHEPARPPRLGIAKPKSVRMDLLSHAFTSCISFNTQLSLRFKPFGESKSFRRNHALAVETWHVTSLS